MKLLTVLTFLASAIAVGCFAFDDMDNAKALKDEGYGIVVDQGPSERIHCIDGPAREFLAYEHGNQHLLAMCDGHVVHEYKVFTCINYGRMAHVCEGEK